MKNYVIAAIKRRIAGAALVLAITPIYVIWGGIAYDYVCDMLR